MSHSLHIIDRKTSTEANQKRYAPEQVSLNLGSEEATFPIKYFKDDNALRSAFTDAGVDQILTPDGKIVGQCGSGMTACVVSM